MSVAVNDLAIEKAWRIVFSKKYCHRLSPLQKLLLLTLSGLVPKGEPGVWVSNEVLGERAGVHPRGCLPRLKARLKELGLIKIERKGRASFYRLPYLEADSDF